MKNILFIITVMLIFSCKQKPKEPDKKYVSVQSIIEKQVAHVDTSLYSIRKIVITDSAHSDTSFIKREEFREAAKDFLSVPDLSLPGVASRFNEDSRYDTLIKRVIFTYTPIDNKTEEIKKQEFLVSPEIMADGTNKVTNIMVDRVRNNRDGYFAQNMLWQTDRSFQVTTTTQKPGEPEKIITTIVVWNEE